MMGRTWIAGLALVLACASACSDANVAGNYTTALTNGTDGCSIGWDVGKEENAAFTVSQTGSDITLQVTGGAAIFVNFLLGTTSFAGSVDGEDVSATSIKVDAPPKQVSGGCQFSFGAKVSAAQNGNSMEGRIEYRAETNGHPDCGSRTNCVSRQEFNASRPPPAE